MICAATWGRDGIGAGLLLKAVSGTMVLQQLRSMWMSVACITTGVQAHHVLGHVLKYKGPAKLSPTHPHCPVVT